MKNISTNVMLLVSAACGLAIGIDYSNTLLIVLSALNIVLNLPPIVLTFKTHK